MARRRVGSPQMALDLHTGYEIAGRAIGTTSQQHPIAATNLQIVNEPLFELIRLFRSQNYTKVDPERYGEFNLIRWRGKRMNWRSPKLYAIGCVGGVDVLMHRLVKRCTDPSIIVDHIHGDTLDNRDIRLRCITLTDNNRNRALRRERGLEWVRERQQWRVSLTVNGTRVVVGHYDSPDEAIEARRGAERHHYGFVMRELLT